MTNDVSELRICSTDSLLKRAENIASVALSPLYDSATKRQIFALAAWDVARLLEKYQELDAKAEKEDQS